MVGDSLYHITKTQYGDKYQEHVLDIYKIYVEKMDTISQRRQHANAFYLSLNTVLISIAGLLSYHDSKIAITVFLFSGFFISLMWMRNIQSYKSINEEKFNIIHSIEERLPIKPYFSEWELIKAKKSKGKHKDFNEVEILVPILFIILQIFFVFLVILNHYEII